MTDLIACLSTGKGTWTHVKGVISGCEWDNIFLITNEFGREKFSSEKKVELIVVDSSKPLLELVEDIKKELKDRVSGTEVALNLVSGTGKEHMAILSAVLKLGLGVRLVALAKEGIKEI
ncbi:hypothetical protein FP803_04250 [Candidatus Woesearchaeota archaeon]|nr:hypothetical protein [Candidatus Woesearchaeota archaeon]MBU3941328.1 hypothetical protein [Nanoarchaeota archaeon]